MPDDHQREKETVGSPPSTRTAIAPDAQPRAYFELMRARLVSSEDESGELSARPLLRGATGLVGERLGKARTLGEAMRVCGQTYNLLHGGTYNHVERLPGALVFRIEDDGFPFAFEGGDDVRATVMEGVQIFTHALLSIWAGRDLSPMLRAVHSRRPRRAHDHMLDFWSVPVRTGASAYLLEYRLEVQALAPEPGERPLSPLDVFDRILSMVEATSPTGTSADFAARVRERIETGARKQEDVARMMGVSVATLRRRLDEEGQTFRDLRAKALDGLARRHLADGRSPDRVATLLGFSDARSFARAFKQWTGMTPAAFARHARRAPTA